MVMKEQFAHWPGGDPFGRDRRRVVRRRPLLRCCGSRHNRPCCGGPPILHLFIGPCLMHIIVSNGWNWNYQKSVSGW